MAWRFFSRRGLVAGTWFAALLLASAVSACGTNKNWLVKPHQREFLADRIMRPDTTSQESAADQHVLTTREGAIGGGGTVGGGCGCN